MQQGDILLRQTVDGGEIEVENGTVLMSGGLETAVFLSLFGGNEQDDGRPDNPATWWGNLLDADRPERQYRSQTQHLIRSIPAVPANLRRVEDAARGDLAWMVTTGAASAVAAVATMPGLNKVLLSVTIDGETVEYSANWDADA